MITNTVMKQGRIKKPAQTDSGIAKNFYTKAFDRLPTASFRFFI